MSQYALFIAHIGPPDSMPAPERLTTVSRVVRASKGQQVLSFVGLVSLVLATSASTWLVLITRPTHTSVDALGEPILVANDEQTALRTGSSQTIEHLAGCLLYTSPSPRDS